MSETKTFHIPAIHCDGCIESIQRIVERQGAAFESGNPETKNVTVRLEGETTEEQIVEALSDADFEPAPSA